MYDEERIIAEMLKYSNENIKHEFLQRHCAPRKDKVQLKLTPTIERKYKYCDFTLSHY